MKLRFLSGALVAMAACAPKSDAPLPTPQQARYTATEFAFTGPDTLKPGMTSITMVNSGMQEHHLILARLDDGKTVNDLMGLMAANPNAPPPDWLKAVGGANGITVGDSTGSTVDLEAGNYIAICFLPDPADGKPHVEKGMMKTIVVAGERVDAPAPVADVEIKMTDFAYEMPEMTGGTHTVRLVNTGTQFHEAQLVRLNDGVDTKTFMAALAPGAKAPPPAKTVGGGGAFSPGKEGYWTTTLTPGNYLFLCFVPDSAGVPHIMKGMVREFTIAP